MGHREALDYPAAYLFAFLDHHGFLVLGDAADLAHRGRRLPRRTSARSPSRLDVVRTRTRVTAVSRKPDAVEIDDELGAHHAFDKVVIATHADQALALLTDADEDEQAVLGAFGYSRNVTAPAPRRDRAAGAPQRPGQLELPARGLPAPSPTAAGSSYWMNRLQGHPESDPLVVTLNPRRAR